MGREFNNLEQTEDIYSVYYFLSERLHNAKQDAFLPQSRGENLVNFEIIVNNNLEEIEKSLPKKYKKEFESFIEEQKRKIKSLTPNEYKPFLEEIFKDLEDNKEDTFVYIFRRFFKSQPELLKDLGNNLEYLDRINDIAGTNKEQKIASILWFGEQGKPEHIAVLEELEKDEDDAEIKSAIKKAMLRLNERINSNKRVDEDDVLLDDSDVYVSPVKSSVKVKMRVRMNGRVKPFPIDEDDVLLDDRDVYVSPVKSSVKVKMRVRMNGRVKTLKVGEEDN